MNKIIYTLITIITFCCTSLNANAGITIIGEGASCGSWVEERQKNSAVYKETYLLGYLSGLAMGLRKDILSGLDASAVYIWTDNYCKANPTNTLIMAAMVFKNEIIKKNGL
jgi:hypothetical protein